MVSPYIECSFIHTSRDAAHCAVSTLFNADTLCPVPDCHSYDICGELSVLECYLVVAIAI